MCLFPLNQNFLQHLLALTVDLSLCCFCCHHTLAKARTLLFEKFNGFLNLSACSCLLFGSENWYIDLRDFNTYHLNTYFNTHFASIVSVILCLLGDNAYIFKPGMNSPTQSRRNFPNSASLVTIKWFCRGFMLMKNNCHV